MAKKKVETEVKPVNTFKKEKALAKKFAEFVTFVSDISYAYNNSNVSIGWFEARIKEIKNKAEKL